MRTKKRDKDERVYHLGYKAGMRGKSTDLCPFAVTELRGVWLGGWRAGRDDLRAGYMDIESV